tara:strand:+ start:402 stop:1565 length:1164 start_codon:yes stop_codon:yes gene_type:complete
MLIPNKIEKDFIYSLIFEEHEKFIKIISNNTVNFERIVSIISFNRIEHFVLNKLNSTFRTNKLPTDFLEQLEKYHFKKAIPTLKIIEKVFLLSNQLQESNLEHVFLKGIGLHDQHKIYMRPIRDIDVLVNEEDITQVINIAKSIGFKFKNESIEPTDSYINNSSFYDLPLMTDENGVFLEIHFRITTNNDNCSLKDNIFKSKRLIKSHGNNIYVSCPNSLFTHLVYHGSQKGSFNVGLIALVDLLQLFDEVDKNEVLKISELLEMRKISELFFELAEFSKNKETILSKDAEKLKEVLIFPAVNSKITEILNQESLSKMLAKFKDTLFVSKKHLQREFEINKSLPTNFYFIKRWARQTNQFLPSFFFVFKNLISVNKRNKTAKALLKN